MSALYNNINLFKILTIIKKNFFLRFVNSDCTFRMDANPALFNFIADFLEQNEHSH